MTPPAAKLTEAQVAEKVHAKMLASNRCGACEPGETCDSCVKERRIIAAALSAARAEGELAGIEKAAKAVRNQSQMSHTYSANVAFMESEEAIRDLAKPKERP